MRAIDKAGNLGPLVTIRFRVGVGIVNAKGKLLKDTVPPSSPKLKPSKILSTGLVLSWRRASDIGGKVVSYRIERNKRSFVVVRGKARTVTIPLDQARGTWSVRAVDRGKNLSPRRQTVTIS